MRIIGVLLASVFAVGCIATVDGPGVAYGGGDVTATVVAPDLVTVSPGVQVVYGYHEPVFYTDGFYWRESGGLWYRSSYHTHGWSTYSAPRSVYSIRDRHSYRNYRPAHYTPRSSYRTHNNSRSYRPDHRSNVRHDTRATHTNNRPNARPTHSTPSKPAPARTNNRPDARKKK